MRAGVQEVAYYQAGPADGDPVLLLHGFPYDIHSYECVIPRMSSVRRDRGVMVGEVMVLLGTS